MCKMVALKWQIVYILYQVWSDIGFHCYALAFSLSVQTVWGKVMSQEQVFPFELSVVCVKK